jgi:hypothetical protein
VTTTPPTIDGDLSDACWQTAYHDDAFWDPTRDLAPEQRTEIWLCVDKGHIYLGAHMHDTSPALIRAEERKRNGAVSADDTITLAIDPTYKLGGVFSFTVNPLGTMKEDIPGGSDAKVEWRGDWVAGARRVDDGWTAEAAVPWTVLRYPGGQTEIALAVARGLPRLASQYIWPDMGAGIDGKELAHIVGLDLPGAHKPILIMPNIQAEWTEGGPDLHLGADVSHTFSNGLTALATVTPDFTNIENEVESIDFSYTERYYSDRRPFFTTGAGFMPSERLFYSRRIDDLDLGVKAFGKIGNTDIGLLQTVSFGQRTDTAAHLAQRLSDELTADAQFVASNRDGVPGNQVWQTALRWSRPSGRGSLSSSVSLSRSTTHGLPAGAYLDVGFGWDRGPGKWSLFGGYTDIDRWFIALDGFVPETDRRGPGLLARYEAKPVDGWLKNYGTSVSWTHYDHINGTPFHTDWSAGAWGTRRRTGDGAYVGENWGERPPNRDRTTTVIYWWGDGQLHKGGSVACTWGRLGSGDYQSYDASASFIIREGFYGNVAYERRISDFWDPLSPDVDLSRYTLRLNYDFDAERGLGFAVRTGTLGTNAFATYRHSARKGRDLFLVLGDPNAESTVPRLGVMTKWVWD